MDNKTNKVLYTGYSNDLRRRIYEHKNKLVAGFTSRYNVSKLVYFESVIDLSTAETREKQIKGWIRRKKVRLIESINPGWDDLAESNQLLNKSLFYDMSK